MLLLHVLKYFSVTTYLFVFFHLTCLLSKRKRMSVDTLFIFVSTIHQAQY